MNWFNIAKNSATQFSSGYCCDLSNINTTTSSSSKNNILLCRQVRQPTTMTDCSDTYDRRRLHDASCVLIVELLQLLVLLLLYFDVSKKRIKIEKKKEEEETQSGHYANQGISTKLRSYRCRRRRIFFIKKKSMLQGTPATRCLHGADSSRRSCAADGCSSGDKTFCDGGGASKICDYLFAFGDVVCRVVVRRPPFPPWHKIMGDLDEVSFGDVVADISVCYSCLSFLWRRRRRRRLVYDLLATKRECALRGVITATAAVVDAFPAWLLLRLNDTAC